ncbi:MAG: hypothetical protein U5O39_13450 [Gammaproteobacteria bacterium]|nr:hypothetical protein [Gammaproteobacteria bacterium]
MASRERSSASPEVTDETMLAQPVSTQQRRPGQSSAAAKPPKALEKIDRDRHRK